MKLIGPGDEITPADVAEGLLLWFETPHAGTEDGQPQRWYLRPPNTEQIDEARYVERVTAAVMRARPEMERLAQLPPSDGEMLAYKLAITRWEQTFQEQEDNTTQKERAADMLAYLQQAMEKRTRADEEAGDRAIEARDRYLTFACLAREDGKRVFRGDDAGASEGWEALDFRVKEAARPHVRRLLKVLEVLPFG